MLSGSAAEYQEGFAIRNLRADGAEWMLRAALVATDHGMLVTGLDQEIIAVNKRFGEFFGFSPKEALDLGLGPLRAEIGQMVQNLDEWRSVTDAIYAEPERVYEDLIELRRDRRLVLSRYSGPIMDAEGRVIGRLWTYRDITQQHRLQEIHQELERISTFFDPDPEVVLRHIVDLVNRHFDDTNAILSLIEGSYMNMRVFVGPHEGLKSLPGVDLKDTFCQFALSTERPIVIQNAGLQEEFCGMTPALVGLTRYLGVPIFDDEAVAVGTLCLIDGQSERQLDELDLQFMSMLAVRVKAELARERHIRERLSIQERQLQIHREDLVATNAVFEAMNSAFSLLSATLDVEDLISRQSALLSGALGYSAALVLTKASQEVKFHGYYCPQRGKKTKALNLEPKEFQMGRDISIHQMCLEGSALGGKLGCKNMVYVVRPVRDFGDVLIGFGRNDLPPIDDRHRIHLEALTEQVCLLMSSYVLQAELVRTNSELENAHDELLRKEKLSVAGTLAASTAHDIRNITASLGLLASPGIASPEATLNLVREQLGRFDVLAHRLLSYAKPRMVAKEEVRIGEIIESVMTLTGAQARVAHVTVERKIGKGIATIEGDSNQIEHLFVNLILNGIQSMDRQGGVLTVSVKSDDEWVKVKIVDNGPGLAPEVRSRLFEPFISSRADGFGLGLYSCKRIVEAHRGTITAKRNSKQGSTFSVILPIKKVEFGD